MFIRLPNILRKIKGKVEATLGHYPDFVFISTGRAGSGFLAKYMSSSGVPCSHEGFFQPDGIHKRLFFRGDSSWLAVPFLERGDLRIKKGIIHHVRHPMKVINSMLGIGFFRGEHYTPFSAFAQAHFLISGDEIADCIRWWVNWNQRCEEIADFSFRIEASRDHIPDIFDLVGVELDDNWKKRLEALSKDGVNSRKKEDLKYEDLPNGKDKHLLKQMAQHYGYEL